jgi:osomolarity two-component system response regulator SSK1
MSRLLTERPGSLHVKDATSHETGLEFQPPSRSKFGFAWPRGSSREAQSRSDLSTRPDHEYPSVTTSPTMKGMESTPNNDLIQEDLPVPGLESTARVIHTAPPYLPPLSRASSMPLPSQLARFQHPRRSPFDTGLPEMSALEECPSNAEQHLQALSLELADSVQMAIQTFVRFSPPQILDSGKEQFSACTVQIPTPSLSAFLTTMKHLNYISANMRMFSSPDHDTSPFPRSTLQSQDELVAKDEFDIGELLQSVGDSLGGLAAKAEVDLVLHHIDPIQPTSMRGDECGISYAISHVNDTWA